LVLDRNRSRAHIAAMLIRTEQTPNPATRKFLPGQAVMEAGTRDFADPESAEASPLAGALFDSGMVEGVFFGRDFISVTAAPGTSWTDLEPLVLETLLDHFVSGAPLFVPGTAAGIHVADEPPSIEENPEDAEIIDQIKELIETRVRPAVAQDGGDIVYKGYKDGRLYLSMHGACSGCPSSTVTLKRGIESLIRHYVPEVETVEAV
jgi:Fe-S cluster biogenesis protein NfuA